MSNRYDVIVIGGGPAGMTAAMYCARAGKKTIAIEKEMVGGKITESPSVKNIPGFIDEKGLKFAENLEKQAIDSGVKIELGTVTKIIPFDDDEAVQVEVDGGLDVYDAEVCIIATGTTNRTLGIENESNLIGRGVCFCVTCDGPFYKGKNVVVVGGGNTALTNAVELSRIASNVTIIQDLPLLTGEKILIDEVKRADNISVITSSSVVKYDTRDGKLVGVTTNDNRSIPCDGVFLSIGMKPNTDICHKVVPVNERGYIIVDSDQRAFMHDNIFACGDCTNNPVKQVAVACGSGAAAAVNAINYLNRRR